MRRNNDSRPAEAHKRTRCCGDGDGGGGGGGGGGAGVHGSLSTRGAKGAARPRAAPPASPEGGDGASVTRTTEKAQRPVRRLKLRSPFLNGVALPMRDAQTRRSVLAVDNGPDKL